MNDPQTTPPDLPSRIGKGMFFGAWVAGLALLSIYFQGFIDSQDNPNRVPQTQVGPEGARQVVLARNRAGHYVATGAINGQPATFLIDTGATNVALPISLARRLHLPLAPGGTSRTANGYVSTWSTILASVDLGGLERRGVRASVLPNMPGDQVLLGMSYLRYFELIQRDDTLTLRRAPRSADKSP